jgi:hypothetical protein
MRPRGRGALAALVLVFGLAARGAAQDAAARAVDLERRGDWAGAAATWRAVLAARPDDIPALLGLERALTPLGRLAEMTAEAASAARRDASPAVLGVAIRVWTAARQPDSARAAVVRWAAVEPGSESPFQEWGIAAFTARDPASARAAYLLGRTLLGRADALAADLAQLAVLEGDYPAAAREWTTAVGSVPGYRAAAVSVLARTPPGARPLLLRELARQADFNAERIAAALLVRWNDPEGGVGRLMAALPPRGSDAVDALQEAAEDLRGVPGQPALLARARVLEQLAGRSPPAQRGRARLDAAQAYADGGDRASARRMLATLAGDSAASPLMAASATSTLVSVLVEEGRTEEADRRFVELAPVLGAEDRERLALRLAQGWIRAGRPGRADTLLAADSSVDALAVRGRAALFRGDLAAAAALLREAGPFTGERPEATGRIGILGLLQILEADSLPALGDALWRLERRDSAGAAAGLERLAPGLPPGHGGAELRLLAERELRAAVALGVAATSPAAELVLADLLVRTGRKPEAIAALEHLLVTWPTSAVVPQARRLLDVARGVVPAT